MLELRGLTRRYGDVLALDNVSFTVGEGSCSGSSAPMAPARPVGAQLAKDTIDKLLPALGESSHVG